jgi:glycosyltransferase involved in cell wall biosynthesis
VFLQKAIMSAYVLGFDSLLRANVPRFVYDIDDAVHLVPPHPLPRAWRLLQDNDQINALMRDAQTVLAGNSWLASEARAVGANARVFPTVVDTDRFHPAAAPPASFLVGWIGSPSTSTSLAVVKPALESLNDAEIVLIGAGQNPGISGAAVVPWSLDREVELVQQCAVGIMPLVKNEWNRGKCALKALQYMACGIPCIATPFGAVTDIVRHNENGLFADSGDAWREAFERMRDPALRARLGSAARATVEEYFSVRSAAPRLRQILEEAARGGAA